MLKKILLLVFIMVAFISLTGCTKKINQNDNIKRIYLSDKYYSNGEFIEVKNNDLKKLENDTYILFTYNNYCTLPIPCEDIFKEFMKTYQIDFLSIPFSEFKESDFYESVKYAPSILIIQNNKIIAYLDANSDSDLAKYQDVLEFSKWLDKYVYFKQ